MKSFEICAFLVFCGVVIVCDSSYLLELRRGTLGFGTWGIPGGHLEAGEDPFMCAERELAEEAGLRLHEATAAGWFCQKDAERRYLALYVAGSAIGEPAVLELSTCERWQWFRSDQLPSAQFVPTKGRLRSGRAQA